MFKTPEQQVRDEFYKKLNAIPKMSKEVIRGWKTTSIPLDALKIIIDMSYYDLAKVEEQIKAKGGDVKKAVNLFKVFNNTLGSLLTTCQKQVDHMETKSIPIHILKGHVKHIKTAFNSGLNGKSN